MQIIDSQHCRTQFNVALVISRFNENVTRLLFESAKKRLQELNFDNKQITAVWVPGAVEIPLTAQHLAQTKKFAAIICLGAVIRGDTDHYNYVCQQASQGCQRVTLDHNLPVIFGVLTTENETQALDRVNYGHYAVDTAVEMVMTLKVIAQKP